MDTGFDCTIDPYEDDEGLWNVRVVLRSNDALTRATGRELRHEADLQVRLLSSADAELLALQMIQALRALPMFTGATVYGPDGEPIPEG